MPLETDDERNETLSPVSEDCTPEPQRTAPQIPRTGAFGQVRWSLAVCCVGLGAVLVAKAIWTLPRFIESGAPGYTALMVFWLPIFGWMAAFPLWVARRKGVLRRPRVRGILKEFAVAIPLVVGLLLLQGLLGILGQYVPGGPLEPESPLAPLANAPNDPRLYLLLIPMFTLGPLAEELFFRGFLYNALRQRITPLFAVLLQGLIFTLFHYDVPYVHMMDLITVFVAGLALAGVYEWRRTLWAPFALHTWRNFVFVGPVIVLMILNSHESAQTWEQARVPPPWLDDGLIAVERQADAKAQRLYAINTWGTKGLHLWKQEVRALEAVCDWFPDDRRACAKARSGIAMIYSDYLRDPMRAIVECDRVLTEFADQTEACAEVLLTKGWAYRDLGDDQASRGCFTLLAKSYPSVEWAKEAATAALETLDGEP